MKRYRNGHSGVHHYQCNSAVEVGAPLDGKISYNNWKMIQNALAGKAQPRVNIVVLYSKSYSIHSKFVTTYNK